MSTTKHEEYSHAIETTLIFLSYYFSTFPFFPYEYPTSPFFCDKNKTKTIVKHLILWEFPLFSIHLSTLNFTQIQICTMNSLLKKKLK